MGFAQVPLRIDGLDAHESHQSLDSLSVDEVTFSLDGLPYSPGTIKGVLVYTSSIKCISSRLKGSIRG